MPLQSMDLDRLLMLAKLTQMEADENQRLYRAKGKAGHRLDRASQLQSEAAVIRREIKRRKREFRAIDKG